MTLSFSDCAAKNFAPEKEGVRERSIENLMYKFVLIASIVLIIGGMLLTACSLFSPLWQIAERPKSAEIHHHGLWWDCVVSDGTLIPLGEAVPIQKSENCANKFDPTVQLQLRSALETSDTSSRELLLHRFLPHHKAVIFFSVFTFVFGTIGLITGACSPCFPPNSLLYVVSIFMTSACSVLSDVIFVFGATKTDEQKEDTPLDEENVVQNRLGIACYLHMVASCFFVMGLLTAIASSYLLISSGKGREGCCQTKKDYLQQHRLEIAEAESGDKNVAVDAH
ncbi:Clc-like protein [Necator americanus]|uniref:Clc-like protein n=1 Tax=Necator americanus TaxID=51031 RepID=W2TTY1_NECAM|nr:Clc-like protein [Necator americanus]ETN85104.1 Clc-like protein [Necator americanus]